jgi:UDP-glucose 4-epimerase
MLVASDIRESPHINAEFIPADLLDFDQVARVVKGSDIVVHLAASPLPVSIEKPRFNARINIEGSLNIMDAARENGVQKIIFSSASSLIGDVKYNPVDENHPATPKTPYGVAKYAIEHYLRVYQELYGLNYLIFRFYNIYGPWQYPESGALIPMVYRKLNRMEHSMSLETGCKLGISSMSEISQSSMFGRSGTTLRMNC